MIHRHGTTKRYSDSTRFNGTIHLVEVPSIEHGDIVEQTRNLLTLVEERLNEAGSDRRHLLMVQVYLTDMADIDGFNSVWDNWVPQGCAPARACIQVVALARPGWKVEVVVTAAQLEI
ncbi:RidA family protein [Limnobacter humi]|uniref:RidA family protein n=1 Tax=Limnobacter humi TaxID=1778671 RepID=A0ABT1WHB6_9BURK|nr:RidA family protein [Limnobacter humi]